MTAPLLGPSSAKPSTKRSSMNVREMDAAQALLGVSPCITSAAVFTTFVQDDSEGSTHHVYAEIREARHGFDAGDSSGDTSTSQPADDVKEEMLVRRPRSGSEGLDYLAALAEKERELQEETPFTASSSDDDDSITMPPPPPRRRPRSVSNPEGMEKWENSSRRHLVLPADILEEELAEAAVAVQEYCRTSPPIPEESEYLDEEEEKDVDDDDDDELEPQEMLRRARSRLLDDMSTMHGEKGVLPHLLSKYAEVYNKNGRIGIYTPQERAAIISRFHQKRTRRNWNKKIRYNCRKNLADRRLRVKGRFVKRSAQQQMKLEQEETTPDAKDDCMPDVSDPEAGFCPTEDQPYRRSRRHTIT